MSQVAKRERGSADDQYTEAEEAPWAEGSHQAREQADAEQTVLQREEQQPLVLRLLVEVMRAAVRAPDVLRLRHGEQAEAEADGDHAQPVWAPPAFDFGRAAREGWRRYVGWRP
jgi:hypothetical protein